MTENLEHRVSVIVPAFNSEVTIEKCLNSIRSQTYKDLEIIVVNDGSTDRSLEKIKLLEKQDTRIKCILQENGGVSKARNRGLDCAKGAWITFVDADDYLEKNCIETLHKALVQYGADISMCLEQKEFPDGALKEDRKLPVSVPECFSVDEGYSYTTYRSKEVVWGTIYKASLLKDIRFAEDLYVGEDTLFFATAAKQSKRMVYTYSKLYHYVQYEESACHGEFTRKKYTELEAWKRVCRSFADVPEVYISARCKYAIICYEMMRKYHKDMLFQQIYYKDVLKEYRRNVKYFMKDQNTGFFKRMFRVLIGMFPGFFIRYW